MMMNNVQLTTSGKLHCEECGCVAPERECMARGGLTCPNCNSSDLAEATSEDLRTRSHMIVNFDTCMNAVHALSASERVAWTTAIEHAGNMAMEREARNLTAMRADCIDMIEHFSAILGDWWF